MLNFQKISGFAEEGEVLSVGGDWGGRGERLLERDFEDEGSTEADTQRQQLFWQDREEKLNLPGSRNNGQLGAWNGMSGAHMFPALTRPCCPVLQVNPDQDLLVG